MPILRDMKKFALTSFLALLCAMASAQLTSETVAIGAGYSNQTWYSLSTGQSTTASKTEWDIAFDLSPQGSSILFNTVGGGSLWLYPHSDTTGWAGLDSAGIAGWPTLWNSDTAWGLGAFSNYADANNPFDLGWGVYSSLTHYVTGDSLYVVKLQNGDYKKVWIRQLASSTYTFTHADLNGSNSVTRTITKSTYAGKEFVYYSLQTDAILDREPLSADWDILFTQYTTFIPTPYSVTGLLVQDGIEVAAVSGVADVNAYANYAGATYHTAMNAVGYDWKAFTGSWVIEDSLLYFLRLPSGDVWKVVMTGFGGSANGEFQFSKQLMNPTAVGEAAQAQSLIHFYPNPSDGRGTLSYTLARPQSSASATVSDIMGRVLVEMPIPAQAGTHLVPMNMDLSAGTYLLRLNLGTQQHSQRLIVH